MKKQKFLIINALAVCLMLLSVMFAKATTGFTGKPKCSILIPKKFQSPFSNSMYILDSAAVTVWFDNNVSTNWKITIIGSTQYDDSSSPGPYYYQEFYTNSSSFTLGTIYRGEYNIYFECLDGDTSAEIDISSGYYSSSLYIFSNSSGGRLNVPVQPPGDHIQGLNFDFRPAF